MHLSPNLSHSPTPAQRRSISPVSPRRQTSMSLVRAPSLSPEQAAPSASPSRRRRLPHRPPAQSAARLRLFQTPVPRSNLSVSSEPPRPPPLSSHPSHWTSDRSSSEPRRRSLSESPTEARTRPP